MPSPTPATSPTSPTSPANPRYTLRQGRHHRPRTTVRAAMRRGVDGRHPLRGRKPRRSQHPGQRAVRPHQRARARRSCSTRPASCKVQRYVQVSTDEVYGSLGPTGLFTEETPLAPNSPYSASKAAADLLVRAYQHTFGLHAVITRCSNNYGPYQFPEKLIPLFITNLMNDQQVPVYGDGHAGPRLDPRARPRPRGRGGLAEGQGRRGVQLRRPLRDAEPAPDPQRCWSCWASRSR